MKQCNPSSQWNFEVYFCLEGTTTDPVEVICRRLSLLRATCHMYVLSLRFYSILSLRLPKWGADDLKLCGAKISSGNKVTTNLEYVECAIEHGEDIQTMLVTVDLLTIKAFLRVVEVQNGWSKSGRSRYPLYIVTKICWNLLLVLFAPMLTALLTGPSWAQTQQPRQLCPLLNHSSDCNSKR